MCALKLIPDGPGTTVELRDGKQGLPVAPRGSVAILSMFPSGPVGYSALVLDSESARRTAGSADDGFEGVLSMGDVYSQSSPPILIARVTDGEEIQARLYLMDRNPNRSMLHRAAGNDRAPLATVKAHNGGRWGGAKRCCVGEVTITAAVVDDNTFDTGLTMLKNIYSGASLYIEGDTGGPYAVGSNTTGGRLEIDSSFSAGVMAMTGTKVFQIILASGKELSCVVPQDSSTGESFKVRVDRKFSSTGAWETIATYSNLFLSDNDSRPWESVIYKGEETDGNYQVELTTSYDGATVESMLPANFCEVPITVNGSTITFQWWRWSADGGNTGNPYVDSVVAVNTDHIEPHVITCTFSDATHADVSVEFSDGSTFDVGSLTLGAEFNPKHIMLTKITMVAGSTPAVLGDVVTIRVNTLPLDLYKRDAYVYPVALSTDGTASVRLKIVSNTYCNVSVRSDLDLAADYGAEASGWPSQTGTIDLTAVTWTVAATFICQPDGMAAITFTGNGEIGITNIVNALTAADTDGIFVFSNDGSGRLVVELAESFGAASSLKITNGTANPIFGFTDNTTTIGTDGHPARIEARWPMHGGYDGDTPSAADYVKALDPDTHVFKRYMCTNLGLVRLVTPSVYSTDVKNAANTMVSANGWMYIAEFDPSLYSSSSPSEAAVSNMTSEEDESDYVEHYFPSTANFKNVAGTKLVERSISGLICGLRAKMASSGIDGERGMHIACANDNEQGRISPRVVGLPDNIGRWSPPVGLLNDAGIVPVLWEGRQIFLFGNRMYSTGRTEEGKRYTLTERAVYYHIARDLFVTTRPFIFKSISSARLAAVHLSLRDKLKVYWNDGWFSDHAGTGFDDQCTVEVPLDLNPASALLEGRVTATVSFRPRPALEDLTIIISPTELTTE